MSESSHAGPSTSRGDSSLGDLLAELEPNAPVLEGDAAIRVTDVAQDSRAVGPGCLFVARKGKSHDGLQFAERAVAAGAAALMVDASAPSPDPDVPVLRVRDLPSAAARAAEAVHGHPSRRLALAGITGTNGKTTVAWLVSAALEVLGRACGTIGTLGFRFAGRSGVGRLTTPEADETSRLLAQMAAGGVTHVAMEVSSVALALGRVEALDFDVAAFTNLSRDHIDFHGTFKAYGEAKARLFHSLAPRRSVINAADAFGAQLLASGVPGAVAVACAAAGGDARLDLSGTDLRFGVRGVRGSVRAGARRHALSSPLLGEHNAENLMVALGVLLAFHVPLEEACQALGRVGPAPGRLESCHGPEDDIHVVVDYAHTPDALHHVLSALRPLSGGRLCCVFGCGGDRDPGKREPMGRAVAAQADLSILTSDNPRSEDPAAIAAQVEPGLAGRPYRVQLDRRAAIEQAVLEAQPGDCVLVAGKGHEPYQEVAGVRLPFDDRDEARRALGERRARGGKK